MARINAWTPDAIAKFWQYYSRGPEHTYFSKQYGGAIVDILSRSDLTLSTSTVLDYGCGIGTLAEHLLRAGARVAGLETSSNGVDRANERLRFYDGWLGAFVAGAGSGARDLGPFDIVTCLEVVEHLDDTTLTNVLRDIRDLLKPGGTAIFTTPNKEHLEDNFIYCPFCDNIFHHVQHMRSFDPGSLSVTLTKEGFLVDFCEGVNLLLLNSRFPIYTLRAVRVNGKVGRAALNIARLGWRCQARVMYTARRRSYDGSCTLAIT